MAPIELSEYFVEAFSSLGEDDIVDGAYYDRGTHLWVVYDEEAFIVFLARLVDGTL